MNENLTQVRTWSRVYYQGATPRTILIKVGTISDYFEWLLLIEQLQL
jgi:hypothetical protein